MNHGLFVAGCSVQFLQSTNGAPRKSHPRRRIPRKIGRSILNARSGGVDHREKEHLACVSRRRLIGIQNSWGPVIQLELVKRFVFAAGFRLCVFFITCRQIVEMQDHPVLSRGMNSLVNAMERLLFWCLEFQIHVAGEAPHGTVH